MKQTNAYKLSLIVLALSFLANTGAYAQDPIAKGALMFTGGSNLGYTSYSPSTGSSSSLFVIDLKGGYFFMDNFAGGVLLDLVSSSSGSTTSTFTSIGAFARYYVGGKFFLGAGVASQSSTGSTSSTVIPIEAGYAFFLSKIVAVEPGLKFTSQTGGSTFGLNIGFTVFLGRE